MLLSEDIFYLDQFLIKLNLLKPKRGKEIHITDAIQLLINDKEKFIAHNFKGQISRLWDNEWLHKLFVKK